MIITTRGWEKRMSNKKKTIGYFLVVAICYMYIATMTSSFGIQFDIIGVGQRRAQLLIMVTLIGIICVISGRMLAYNNILKSGALLMFYMFILGTNQNGNLASWISCSVMWYFILLIIYNMNFCSEDIIAIAPILLGTSVALSAVYLYGILNKHTILSVASSNSIYYVLCALPFVFLIPKIKWQLIGLFVASASILISGKGTCLLSLAIIWAIFAVKYINPKTVSISKIMIRLGIVVLFLIVLAAVLQTQTNMKISEVFGDTWSELTSGGNGRSEIYASAWNEFVKSDFWSQLVGHGFGWIDSAISIGTHNDFLMVLCNYGLIGFLLYLSFWLCLIQSIFQLKKMESEFLLAYEVSVIAFFAVSMGSNVLNTQIQFLLLCVLWGMCSPHRCRNNSDIGDQYENCTCNS